MKQHNQEKNNSYQIGMNQFSDLTIEEFQSISLNQQLFNSESRKLENIKNENQQADFYLQLLKTNASSLPQQFDWRNLGKVTQVKNQGNCGSCWAFTITGLFESINLIRNKTVELYSEQELLDCSSNGIYRNSGCQGGWPHLAFEYSKKNGISLSSQYPYKGIQENCTVNQQTKKAFYPSQPIQIQADQESNKIQIIKQLLLNSPLAVIVDASNWSNYKSGVFSNCTTQQNHVALLVGYTNEGNWIIKNSWGSAWGESGYITLSANNACGLENNILGSTII
ncbi:papain family cysteine protease (macronuclear) [Tetrahymena thermophila SB210]|uniref:Papain family cysteine protease n=1 Tax=Tetrahymena thermophila (strain SB210) TaxID=312017 RepID=I7LTZ1_TETTS|nr:papain family cysteine protease [Tetrahymena thermophila SB210]EAR87560.1 papain family cysteine protease [Tetrahymena thermophila SB210]|eukprot:XP_001007805.1 papain family cysteine protease [Tetrahymena thermophila SB210]